MRQYSFVPPPASAGPESSPAARDWPRELLQAEEHTLELRLIGLQVERDRIAIHPEITPASADRAIRETPSWRDLVHFGITAESWMPNSPIALTNNSIIRTAKARLGMAPATQRRA